MTGYGRYDSEREVKLQLPEDMVEDLHKLKTVRGILIKDIVSEALDRYFQDIKENGLR